jgi:hypothetical protein
MNRITLIVLLLPITYQICCLEPIVEPTQPIVNEDFKIKITTARQTSFDWYFKEIRKQISGTGRLMPLNPAWVIPYGEPTYAINPKGKILKDETKIFTFKALQPGTVVLVFEKKHRYKNGKKVTETKEVKVTIAKENIQKK